MDTPLFVTRSRGQPWVYLTTVLAALVLTYCVGWGFINGEGALILLSLLAFTAVLWPALVIAPISIEVWDSYLLIRLPFRTKVVSLSDVSRVRTPEWWDPYLRFRSVNHATSQVKLLLVERANPGRFNAGWFLTPEDDKGFIEALNTALARYRRLNGTPA